MNIITFILAETEKERRDWHWKTIQRNNVWKLLKFVERHKPTDPRSWSWETLDRINSKKFTWRFIKIELLNTKGKDKMDSLLTGELHIWITEAFSSETREARIILFIYRKNKTVNYRKNILQEWGKVQGFSD